MSLPTPSRSQLVRAFTVIVIVAVVGGLGWAFGRQLLLWNRMHTEAQRLEAEVDAAAARNEDLVATLEYVQTDEYVEQWAREEARLARPGEVVVIPLEEPEAPTVREAEEGATPMPTPKPLWAKVWVALFGPDSLP